MPSRSGNVTEYDVALAVLQIAAGRTDGFASFDIIRRDAPGYLTLSDYDRSPSPTRQNEARWEQKIRNIQSHHDSPRNFIQRGLLESVRNRGYRATDAGRVYLATKGL